MMLEKVSDVSLPRHHHIRNAFIIHSLMLNNFH